MTFEQAIQAHPTQVFSYLFNLHPDMDDTYQRWLAHDAFILSYQDEWSSMEEKQRKWNAWTVEYHNDSY